jgi:hypothetical protein
MNNLNIVIVDDSLIFTSVSLDENLLEAFKFSLVYAQAAARGTGELPDSPTYFSQVQKKLETKGSLLNSSSKSSVSLQTFTKPNSLAEAVLQPFVKPLIPKNNAWPSWEIILQSFENVSTQVEIALNFWWDKVYYNKRIYMNMGAIFPTDSPSTPLQAEIVRFAFDPSQIKVKQSLSSTPSTFNPETWSSLFQKTIVQIHPLEVWNLSVKLDISKYHEEMNSDLKNRLLLAFEKHVRSAS